MGATVFATAGAQEKHEFLRSLGVKYITSSRNGAQFEEDMKRMLKEDGRTGIDVVINSLSHDDYIPRSINLLNKGGRFMEIGKRGIWSHEQVKELREDVYYEKIAADTMMEKEPWRYNGYLKRLLTRAEEGGLKPINLHLFDGLERGVAALQFLQRANNIGKVVISQPSRMLCNATSAPLLSGGLGALGVVTTNFLVEEGAKSLVLTSRSGKPSSDVAVQWEWLQSALVEVHVMKCDAGEEASVLQLRKDLDAAKLPPLHSLFHLAGVLADGMLPALTRDHLERSYAPKVHGLYNLCKHLVYQEGAAHLLFSSTSALFGSPGQANYSASNSVLDSLAPNWTARDRPSWSIQWGPWAQVGMAVQKNTLARAKAMGVGALGNAQGLSIMASAIISPEPVVGAVPVRWGRYLRTAYVRPPKFLEDLEAEAKKEAQSSGPRAAAGGGGAVGGALAGLSAEERLASIQSSLRNLAREVVDSQDLSADEPLLDSGMDSLSGVEFRNRLTNEFEGVRLPNSLIFDHPTVTALAGFISGQIGDAAPETSSSSARPAAVEAPAAQQEQLLEKLNDRTAGQPIFFCPGAGLQAGGFRPLGALLPVPAYGLTWPKSALPREEWPATLRDLALLFLQEVRKVQPTGPYVFSGHSFGATVSIEMARLAEEQGEKVALVALLDPRSLTPMKVDIGGAFAATDLADSLALLAQTVPDGASRYADALQAAASVGPADREGAVRRLISPAALASLEHVHETTKWYSTLLAGPTNNSRLETRRIVVLHTAETWLQPVRANESVAEKMVREFQTATFQQDQEVTERIAALCGEGGPMPAMKLPGSHFTMLHEPAVVTLALRVCRALDEAECISL